MLDAFDIFKTTLLFFRRFKIFFILSFYAVAITAVGYEALFFIVFLMLPSVFAYVKDKEREEQGMDNFTGDRLFFRYDKEIHHIAINIPVASDWDTQETSRFAIRLREDLAERVRSRIPAALAQADMLIVGDQDSQRKKEFLRILIRSQVGSLLAHFVHYASYGPTITAHYFTFVRGKHTDWDLARFVIESPFTFWFWGIPWLRNQYSIIAELSDLQDNSFDTIDLQTMYNLVWYVVRCETEAVLEEAGLLTPDLKEAVVNQFNSIQYIVSGSSGVSFGNVSQSVSQPAPAMQKAS